MRMQSMLCATACARTAASVCVRLPYLYDSGWPGLILEGVRVHRVEAEPERGAAFPQRLHVVGAIPGQVQRHRRRGARQAVDDGAVFELLEDVARLARAREAREARAARAHAPRGNGDFEAARRRA